MSIRLSLCLAVILMVAVVGFGFDHARAGKIDSGISTNVRMNNEASGGQYYRHYYRHYRRHYRHHYRHHRHYRRYRYGYYRR